MGVTRGAKGFLVVTLACAVTVGTTAYAKIERELYPSVIFPSFGQVLDPDEVPLAVGTLVVLHHGDETLTVTPRDWFVGPSTAALDQLAGSLLKLPNDDNDNIEWMFERADELAGVCVERIAVVVSSDAAVSNTFERRCE